ncbi:YolD-like family protein [Evansella cellulosilytica]|uniref:YolD-like protein n=1 Tax=Evansella cellulosilytica (strain ATCC 21833 / DSM 2522 / FERM P-1141 / JCM 9156 / N-4) TaxID=649639 RepID=E6TXV5_EVAC2|nr:YolD-like family protein [Evansella cellulosilytica]ADU30031.1 YolD-like protein [Evansella cellulosilytica DSM 2522]
MLNKDRGVIKWTSMMLPEHVQQLKELSEKQKVLSKPIIDEQLFEEWSRILEKAYHEQLVISATKWKNGHEENILGYLYKMDQVNRCLILQHPSSFEKQKIMLSELTHLTTIDRS